MIILFCFSRMAGNECCSDNSFRNFISDLIKTASVSALSCDRFIYPEHIISNMLNRNINILADSWIIPDQWNKSHWKVCRIEIMQPYPFKRFNFQQSGDQFRKQLFFVEVKPIIAEILGNENQFFNSLIQQVLRLL